MRDIEHVCVTCLKGHVGNKLAMEYHQISKVRYKVNTSILSQNLQRNKEDEFKQ